MSTQARSAGVPTGLPTEAVGIRSTGRDAFHRVQSDDAVASAVSPTRAASAERLLQRKYRELIRKHLSHILGRLFAEFTRIHFHVAWTVAAPNGWEAHSLPSGCSVCCKLSGSPLLPECRTCGPHHLATTNSDDDVAEIWVRTSCLPPADQYPGAGNLNADRRFVNRIARGLASSE